MADASGLIDGLRRWGGLLPAHLDELSRLSGDAEAVARHAVAKQWVTDWQAREALAGRAAGLNFGHFQLLQFIARTPFGEMFFARHPALQQAVIVERFEPARWPSAEAAGAFVARAQGVCLAVHPTLQAILDAGMVEDVPFCVREAIDGEPLSYFVGKLGPVPAPLAALYTSRLAEAVAALHEKGAVHGAVNPLFALLTPLSRARPHSPRPMAGAAPRLAGAASFPVLPALNEPAAEGVPLEWLGYLPPERYAEAVPVPEHDWFGVGAVAYYLLTGKPPFAGPGRAEIVEAVRAGSFVPLAEVRPDLPADFAALVERLLAADPSARPTSLEEVVGVLWPHLPEGASPKATAASHSALPASETMTLPSTPPGQLIAGGPLVLGAFVSDSISGLSVRRDVRVPANTPAPLVEAMTSSALTRAAVSPYGDGYAAAVEPLAEYLPDLADAREEAAKQPPAPPKSKYTRQQKRLMLVGAIVLGVVINIVAIALRFMGDDKPRPIEPPEKTEKKRPAKRPAGGDS